MASIDIGSLLTEISSELPCGENLEYDPAFAELETLARDKLPGELGDGEDAQSPKWPDVRKAAAALLDRTRDLRVAVHMTRALTNTEGIVGLRDGLALIQGLLEERWDTVYPLLDHADNDDPTERVNSLAALNDPLALLRDIRNAPLVTSAFGNRYSLRDVLVASGKLPPHEDEGSPPSQADIDGAFAHAELERLQELVSAATEALEHSRGIEALVMDKVGAASSLSLDGLTGAIDEVRRAAAAQLERRGGAALPGSADGGAEAAPGADRSAAGGAAAGALAPGGEFANSQQVMLALDRMCAYFRRHEPSSPVPLLLLRAKRLVAKDFMTILRDLAPDGVPQMELLSGGAAEEAQAQQQHGEQESQE